MTGTTTRPRREWHGAFENRSRLPAGRPGFRDVTRLEFPVYLDHIRRDSPDSVEVLASCDPVARVRPAPLVGRRPAVAPHHRPTLVVGDCPTVLSPPTRWSTPRPDRPEGYDALLDTYDAAHASFAAAVEAADPTEPAYPCPVIPPTTPSVSRTAVRHTRR